MNFDFNRKTKEGNIGMNCWYTYNERYRATAMRVFFKREAALWIPVVFFFFYFVTVIVAKLKLKGANLKVK